MQWKKSKGFQTKSYLKVKIIVNNGINAKI